MIRWLIFVACLVMISIAALAGPGDQWAQCEYLPGRLIVDFAPSINPHVPTVSQSGIVQLGIPSLDELFQEFEVTMAYRLVPDGIIARLKTPPDLYRTYVLIFRREYPALSVLDRFASDPNVTSVEPDLLSRTCRAPNDNLWGSQWDKRVIGADVAWDFNTGDSSMICVGIDTGVDWNHPDIGLTDTLNPSLGWALWVNPDEDVNGNRLPYNWTDYPGDTEDLNGVDDGENGYVDDFLGWDFIRNIGGCATGEDCDNQQDNDMFGMESHGTHVGGLMAAHGNNGVGVAGGMWDGRLMALRAGYLSSSGQGYMPESATVPAIYYAAANGAKVLNMSYGGPGFSSQSQNACNSAWNQGCILFAASGNDGSSSPNHYPANYENVIAVNSTNDDDALSDFSNRGTWTDLDSPGGYPGIWSTVVNGYGGGTWVGTSMASPNAAGIAALLWCMFPSMTNAEIRDLIFNTAEDITGANPGIPPNHLGFGRVDARNAVASVYPHLSASNLVMNDNAGDGDHRLEQGESGLLSLTFTNEEGWSQGQNITGTISAADSRLTITNASFFLGDIPPGSSVDNSGNPVTVTASSDFYQAFWAELTATFTSPTGYTQSVTFQLRVGRGTILIVDDDGGTNYQSFYETVASGWNLTPDIWTTATDGDVPATDLGHYPAIIWECGDQSSNTLTASDQASLSAYLNGGGRLLLVGQNIPEDIGSTSFHTDYLHASNDNETGDRRLWGVTDNPISSGDTLLLVGGSCAGNGTVGPSRITPVGGGETIFTYSEGGIGGVMYNGAYKVVYCAFALEAACGLVGTEHHSVIIQNVFNWFQISDAPDQPGRDVIPTAIALHGNYPNPFNPTTTISFDLPSASPVKLSVYDLLGREVAALVDAPLAAGSHQITFDGTGRASGVYIVRLTAAQTTLTSKMVLMK